MPTPYRHRTLASVLRRGARTFPAVIVTGPRQSGKTTLVQKLFGDSHAYCSLDDPAVRLQAQADPALLLQRFAPPVILDEIQYAPDLLHYVKLDIDRRRAEKGRFVITGSQVFPLMQGVAESLAGRAAVTSLLSLSVREAFGAPEAAHGWREALEGAAGPISAPAPEVTLGAVLRGGYPEPALDPEVDLSLWHASYVQTYLERDVRTLRGVADLSDFQRFLFALAARTAQLVSFEDLARDLGISGKTVKAWISVLEASGQVATLRPYHVSRGKRLVKRPKVYFLDTGTLAYLLAVRDIDQLRAGLAAGPIFEAAVLGQLQRMFLHRGEPSRLYFWRTAAGHEIDFVVENGQQLIPIEAKLTASPSPRDAAPIEAFQKLFGKRAGRGLVVCLVSERVPLSRTVDAVPIGVF
ncbi:MAG: hypothetical protein A2V88_13045 [Elusimicrobia bacterium RBG_16_66_12]|nr:MAG: hypothetical protein A2V88_13045 [Elusimicrobia bacterium RBG_16_66_12]